MITPTDMMRVWFQAWFSPVRGTWYMPSTEAWMTPASRAWFPFASEAWFPEPSERPADTETAVQLPNAAKKPNAVQEMRRVRPVTVSIAGTHAAVALLPKRTTH